MLGLNSILMEFYTNTNWNSNGLQISLQILLLADYILCTEVQQLLQLHLLFKTYMQVCDASVFWNVNYSLSP